MPHRRTGKTAANPQVSDEAIPASFEPVGESPAAEVGSGVVSAADEPIEALVESVGQDDSVVEAVVEELSGDGSAAGEAAEGAGEGAGGGTGEAAGEATDSDGEVLPAEIEPIDSSEGAGEADDAADGADGDAAGSRTPKHARPSRKITAKRVVGILLAVLLVAALVCAGLFTWQRWHRFDDATDIQGTWQVQATGETVVIDAHDLKVTKSISYAYTIDPQSRTIAFNFGKYEGGGRYYLSEDRQTLLIVEGGEDLGVWADLGFLPEDVVNGEREVEGLSSFKRLSNDATAEPSSSLNGLGMPGQTGGERPYIGYVDVPSNTAESESSSSSSSSSSHEDETQHEKLPEGLHRAEDGYVYDDQGELYEEYGNPYQREQSSSAHAANQDGEDPYASGDPYAEDGQYGDGASAYDTSSEDGSTPDGYDNSGQ